MKRLLLGVCATSILATFLPAAYAEAEATRDEQGRVRYHYVIIDFYAHPTGGTLRPAEDADDARLEGLDALDLLDMTEPAGEIAREVLKKVLKE